jgi:hypothetical protein
MFLNSFGNTVHRLDQDPEIKFPLVYLKSCMAVATLCLGGNWEGRIWEMG